MKVGGQILWNVTPICETSQIYYLMGRRPVKDVLGNHLQDGKEFTKVLGADEEIKSQLYWKFPLRNLGELVENCHGIILRQHLTVQRQMELLNELYEELWKGLLQYCCNHVWMKNGGRIPWNAAVICETCKISCLMGRHLVKGGSEYHLTAQLSRLEQWSNNTLFLLKHHRDCINSVLKSCQVYSLDMCCTLGKSGKETCWSQTLKNRRKWTHLNSMVTD